MAQLANMCGLEVHKFLINQFQLDSENKVLLIRAIVSFNNVGVVS